MADNGDRAGEDNRQWYAVRSKPRKEAAAAAMLERAGIGVFVPQVKVKKRPYDPPSVEPLFPGYFFSRLAPQMGEIRLVKYTPGVLYVLGFGDEPWPVPDSLVAALQERVAAADGWSAGPDYQPGDRVKVTRGPLRDLDAIFDRRLSPKGRARILVHILMRICRVEVHVSDLRRVSQAAEKA
jgi:transcriptional antiterminator RfaH